MLFNCYILNTNVLKAIMKIKTIFPISFKRIVGLSAIGAMFVIPACTGADSKKGEGASEAPVMEFMGYKYDALAQVPDSNVIKVEGGNLWRYSGSGMLPVRIGNHDVSLLRDSLERLGGVVMTDSVHAVPVVYEGLNLTEIESGSMKACTSTSNQLSLALCTPEVVVWRDYVYTYLCMSAHGTYKTTFVNYGVEDGKILTMNDLMKSGYEPILREMIRKKLKENDIPLLVPVDEVSIPDDFEITTRGIRFLFGLYEIAAYVEGEISVEFDAYELEDILAPGVASRFFSIND